jgi:hypothetical protein
MADRYIARTGKRTRTSRGAHVIERIGLAMAGASCGLFVAAHVASPDIEVFNSLGFVFALMIFGAMGFYLGIDIPPAPTQASFTPVTELSIDNTTKADPVELLSATGTFLTSLAALISVYIIVFDEMPSVGWTLALSLCWLFGCAMQIIAGVTARMRVRRAEMAGG